jgi:hypothetical protein
MGKDDDAATGNFLVTEKSYSQTRYLQGTCRIRHIATENKNIGKAGSYTKEGRYTRADGRTRWSASGGLLTSFWWAISNGLGKNAN